jgi:hypothetical protein
MAMPKPAARPTHRFWLQLVVEVSLLDGSGMIVGIPAGSDDHGDTGPTTSVVSVLEAEMVVVESIVSAGSSLPAKMLLTDALLAALTGPAVGDLEIDDEELAVMLKKRDMKAVWLLSIRTMIR